MKLLYYLSTVTIASAFLLIVSIFFVHLYPFEPVRFDTNPFKTEKLEYTAGEWIQYELEFTKFMDIKPMISYYLADGIVYPLSKEGLSRPVGKQSRRLSLQIPEGIPSGEYSIQIDFDYPIYWRHIYKTWQSNRFVIHSKPETR